MRFTRLVILLIITLVPLLSACQETKVPVAPLPTLAALPTLAELPTLPPSATPVFSATPSQTPLPSATPTASPTQATTEAPSPTLTDTPAPASATPTMTSTLLPEAFTFGRSVEGRDLLAYRLGTGSRTLLLVGGIHAGFEANTIRLVEELYSHFSSTPGDIRPGISLLLVPSLNPDGVRYGRELRGRFNANNVDLNRNWACGWSTEAEFGGGLVDAGAQPFSEPETLALGALIQQVQPVAVLFYHSAARGVFAGDCERGISAEMAAVYGEASGYPYGEAFEKYRVSGSAPAWVDSQGIPAADVELASADLTELVRNLRAIMALQDWALRLPQR